jgi:hypothetical protein
MDWREVFGGFFCARSWNKTEKDLDCERRTLPWSQLEATDIHLLLLPTTALYHLDEAFRCTSRRSSSRHLRKKEDCTLQ